MLMDVRCGLQKNKRKKKHAPHFIFLALLPQVQFSKGKKKNLICRASFPKGTSFTDQVGLTKENTTEEGAGGWGVEPPRQTIKSERSVNSFGK